MRYILATKQVLHTNRHSIALQHAQSAIEIFKTLKPTDSLIYEKLTAAYYNAGVECEYLKKKRKALQYYQLGLNICTTNKAVKDGLKEKLLQSYQELYASEQVLSNSRKWCIKK